MLGKKGVLVLAAAAACCVPFSDHVPLPPPGRGRCDRHAGGGSEAVAAEGAVLPSRWLATLQTSALFKA